MRSSAAGLLALVGLLLVPLADVGLWTQRQLLPTESFTDLSVEVLHQPEVGDALAVRLTDEIDTHVDLSADTRAIVESAVRSAVATPEFEQVFRVAVGSMHEQLERGDDQLALDFDPALPAIKTAVARFDQNAADQIPDTGLPAITVLRESEVPAVWQAVDVARRAALVFPIAAVLVLAVAVLMSWRRAQLVIMIGVGLVVLAVALALLVGVGRDLLSDVIGDDTRQAAFTAGYNTVTESFVTQTAALAAIGVFVGGSGIAMLWRQRRNRRPIGWA
jgi:hypothetical protein